MDSLTVHYLARELDARWRGRRIRAFVLDRNGRAATFAVEGSRPVRVDLSAPAARVREAGAPAGEGLLTGWSITQVCAPTDDRRILVQVEKPGKFRGSPTRGAVVEMSLVPTARGVVVHDGHGHRIAAMGARLPDPAGPRPLLTPDELWHAAERQAPDALLHGRWMHPLLARWLVHSGGAMAVERYAALCELPAAEPSECDGQRVPFPWCEGARSVPSLVESEQAGQAPAPAGAESRTRRARTVARMREELDRAAGAPRLRLIADALLAMGDVPAPAEVVLPDGTRASVPEHTDDTAVAAAERLYREVRSMERALASLPDRIAAIERAAEVEGSRAGENAPQRPTPRRARSQKSSARPFRSYRSSGGLDIWVGRGAASNDALTFREAAPNDVWLHARDAAGAHVVLRWTHEEPPPARDLEEAAALAAWHSKGRSSAVVPVDWTRRKHVHKVRGGAPGLVTVQRARTIFARPHADIERALRADR